MRKDENGLVGVCSKCGRLMCPVYRLPEVAVEHIDHWPKTIVKPEIPSDETLKSEYGYTSDALLCMDCFCEVVTPAQMVTMTRKLMGVVSSLMGELQLFAGTLKGVEELDEYSVKYAYNQMLFLHDVNSVVSDLLLALHHQACGESLD